MSSDPRYRELNAELMCAAATALSVCGRDADALAAHLDADDLFAALDRIGARARCLRCAAWLQFWSTEPGGATGMRTMRTLLQDLERLAVTTSSPEVLAELVRTRRHLANMRDEVSAE